ncbi:formin-binding protein 1a [Polymixia lowei]
MSGSWGTELWDQFDSLEKHTSWGIDFLERYTKFVKERADIELSYAKQIRNLSKKFQPKKSCREEEESRYSWCRAFGATLRELNHYAGHREALAQNLHTHLVSELTRYTQDLKAERKSHFQDGRRAQQHIENSWKQLESSKRRFERDCKEAERAQQNFDRIDIDNNKADGEKRCSLKARHTAQQKQQAAEDSKRDYLASLNQFNQDQHQHYHTLVPVIYQRIQDMEERRITRVGEAMHSLAEVERKVQPVISLCLDGMIDAADSIQPRMDTQQVVEVYKSGFEPPGDVQFEDHGAPMRRSISESSYLDNRADGRRHSNRTSRGKLWPLLRKNKLMSLLSSPHQPPPPPPTSPSPEGVADSPRSPPPPSREPITQRLNDFMTSGSRTRKQCLRSLKRGLSLKLGSGPEDCSHLPSEQRRKKLEKRISNMRLEIQREREKRDALAKMREVYERSPEMGDTGSLEPRMEEITHRLDRLEEDLRRHQGWLAEADSRTAEHNSRWQSGGYGFDSQATTPGSSSLSQLDNINHQGPASRESPDGSYTEDHSAELNLKSRSSEFDDDFDEEEPLPSIGTCKSLYPFQGQNEGTISMVEGELLSVVEEDKGDGWTRVRRNQEEEGYVPTSYIKVFLDGNSKGAMTYI